MTTQIDHPFSFDLPDPIEVGRGQYDWIMQHGTAFQKESLLIVLHFMARRNCGPNMAEDIRWNQAVDRLWSSMCRGERPL